MGRKTNRNRAFSALSRAVMGACARLAGAKRPQRKLEPLPFETFEERVLLSSVDVTAGVLGFTAGAGIGNQLTVSISGGNVTLTDPAETITLTANALGAGWAGDGTNTVTGPVAGLTSFAVDTGDGNDNVTIQQMSVPTAVQVGAGTDALTLGTGGSVAGITNTVALSNSAGQASLTIDASADGAQTLSMSNNTLSGLAGGDVTYPALAAFLLTTGGQADTITVTGAPGLGNSINTGGGDDTINVQATTQAVAIDAGAGTNAVNLGNAGSMAGVTSLVSAGASGGGTVDLSIDSTANGAVNLTVGAGQVTGYPNTVSYSNLNSLTIRTGAAADTVTVSDTPAATSLFTGNSDDTVNIAGSSHAISLDTEAGADTVNITNAGSIAGIGGTIDVASTGGTASITVDDSADGKDLNVTISASALSGLLPAGDLTYPGSAALTVNTGTGADNVTVSDTPNTLGLDTGAGDDTVNITGNSDVITLETGSGANTVNVGNVGSLAGIAADIDIAATGGTLALVVDASADAGDQTLTLSPTQISGFAGGNINMPGATALTLTLGSGADTLTISDTPSQSPTISTGDGDDTVNIQATSASLSVDTGTGANTVNIGNAGSMAGIGSAVTLSDTGAGTSVIIDASADGAQTIGISDTAVTGFGADINYGPLTLLQVGLGAGADTVNITGTPGPTSVATNDGDDTINLLANTSQVTIVAGAGTNAINIGDTGSLANIGAAVSLDVSGGTDNVLIDDSADATAQTLTLDPTGLSGLAGGTIGFTGTPNSLTLNLGTGGDTVGIADTAGPLTLNTGDGDDTVNINANADAITLDVGTGANTVMIGSNAPGTGGNLDGVAAQIDIAATGGTLALTLDDSGTANSRTLTINGTTVSGYAADVNYPADAAVTLNTGSGDDSFTIAAVPTGTLTINAGDGADTFGLSANDLTLVNANITLNGEGGSDTLNLDDTNNAVGLGSAYAISDTQITSSDVAGAIGYSGIDAINLTMQTAADALTLTALSAATALSVTGNGGGDTYNISAAGIPADSSVTIASTSTDTYNIDGTGGGGNIDGTVNVTDDSANPAIGWTSSANGAINIGITGAGFALNLANILDGGLTSTVNLFANGGTPDVTTIGADGTNTTVTLATGNTVVFPMAAPGSTTINGTADDDQFVVDFGGGANNPIAGGLVLNGGAGSDEIIIQNGSATDEVFTATAVGDGTVNIDGQVLTYTGLEPITDTISAATVTINTLGTNVNVVDGPVVGIDQTGQINDNGTASFETINYANKTMVTVNGTSGDNTIAFNMNTVPAGLSTDPVTGGLHINGNDGADTFDVNNVASGLAATLMGGNGEDIFNINGGLASILGALHVDGNDPTAPADPGDTVNLVASGALRIYTDPVLGAPNTRVEDGTTNTLDYVNIETFNLTATTVWILGDRGNNPGNDENDTFNVVGTGANTADISVNGGSNVSVTGMQHLMAWGYEGDDILNVQPYATNLLNTWGVDVVFDGGDGNDQLIYTPIDAVAENVAVTPSGIAGAGQLTSNIASSNTSIVITNFTNLESVLVNGSDGSQGDTDALVVSGTQAADTIVVNGNTTPLANGLNVTSNLPIVVNGSGGDDTIVVNSPTVPVIIDGGSGSDAVNFIGSTGDDTLNFSAIGDALSLTGTAGTAFAVTITSTENVNVDGNGGTDAYTFNGGAGNDNILVTPALAVSGIATTVNLTNTTTADTLTLNGGAGNDVIKAQAGAEANIQIVADGGDGNDWLSADATLIGGAGNDTLAGGAGDDSLSGGAGDDTFMLSPGADSIDGGDGYDTILVEGTAAADSITVNQTSDTSLDYVVNAASGTVTLADGTVENIFVDAGAGNDTIGVTQADGLTPASSLQVTIDGGSDSSGDRLIVTDAGTGDLVLYRRGANAASGSITVGSLAPVVYTNVEVAQPVAAADGQVVTINYDAREYNDTRGTATYLGTGASLNVVAAIDPVANVGFSGPGDMDYYRILAGSTGLLVIDMNAAQIATVASGRPGLPGNGALLLQLQDANGNVLANDGAANAQLVVPAVAGQAYFVVVSGATTDATNTYGLTISNMAAPAAVTLNIDPAGDSGSSNTDNITNVATPQLFIQADLSGYQGVSILSSAQAEAGSTAGVAVEVFDNGVSIGFADLITVPDSGNTLFTFDFTGVSEATLQIAQGAALNEGMNQLTAAVRVFDGSNPIASDRVGLSAPLNVTLDTNAPDAPSAPAMTASSDTGAPGDNVTDVTSPTFQGTAEANSLVRLFVTDGSGNTQQVGQAVAGSDASDGVDGDGMGAWTITSAALGYGAYTVQANAEDAAGNISSLTSASASSMRISDFSQVRLSAANNYVSLSSPRAVVSGDLNGDGRPDMVAVNNSGTISVFMNRGDTGFTHAYYTQTGGKNPIDLALADFNGDGILDVVTANRGSDNVSVLIGKGRGNFEKAKLFKAGENPLNLRVGDINGDGKADVVLSNHQTDRITMLMGNGNGGFSAPVAFHAYIGSPTGLDLQDLNGDGFLDLVLIDESNAKRINVFKGNGQGKFVLNQKLQLNQRATSVSVSDINSDGVPDIVASSDRSNFLTTFIGKGGAKFQPSRHISYFGRGVTAQAVSLADINGDGYNDIVTANPRGNELGVMLGNGNGTFQRQLTIGSGRVTTYQSHAIAATDFNNDGLVDLAIADGASNDINVLFNAKPN